MQNKCKKSIHILITLSYTVKNYGKMTNNSWNYINNQEISGDISTQFLAHFTEPALLSQLYVTFQNSDTFWDISSNT